MSINPLPPQSTNYSSPETNSVKEISIIDNLVDQILTDLGEEVKETSDCKPVIDKITTLSPQKDININLPAAKTFLLSKKLFDCFSKEGKMAPLVKLEELKKSAIDQVKKISKNITEGKTNPKLFAKICFCIFLPFKNLGEMFKNLYRGAGFKMDFQVLEKSKENFDILKNSVTNLSPLLTQPAYKNPSDIGLLASKISAFLDTNPFNALPLLIKHSLSETLKSHTESLYKNIEQSMQKLKSQGTATKEEWALLIQQLSPLINNEKLIQSLNEAQVTKITTTHAEALNYLAEDYYNDIISQSTQQKDPPQLLTDVNHLIQNEALFTSLEQKKQQEIKAIRTRILFNETTIPLGAKENLTPFQLIPLLSKMNNLQANKNLAPPLTDIQTTILLDRISTITAIITSKILKKEASLLKNNPLTQTNPLHSSDELIHWLKDAEDVQSLREAINIEKSSSLPISKVFSKLLQEIGFQPQNDTPFSRPSKEESTEIENYLQANSKYESSAKSKYITEDLERDITRMNYEMKALEQENSFSHSPNNNTTLNAEDPIKEAFIKYFETTLPGKETLSRQISSMLMQGALAHSTVIFLKTFPGTASFIDKSLKIQETASHISIQHNVVCKHVHTDIEAKIGRSLTTLISIFNKDSDGSRPDLYEVQRTKKMYPLGVRLFIDLTSQNIPEATNFNQENQKNLDSTLEFLGKTASVVNETLKEIENTPGAQLTKEQLLCNLLGEDELKWGASGNLEFSLTETTQDNYNHLINEKTGPYTFTRDKADPLKIIVTKQ